MQRTILNFWLDVTLCLMFLAVLWSSFVIHFVFPPGTVASGWALWGYDYDDWCGFRFALICGFAMAVLIHVMLHWSWVCGVLTSRILRRSGGTKRQWSEGEQTLYGVGLIVIALNVLGIAFAAAVRTVQAPG